MKTLRYILSILAIFITMEVYAQSGEEALSLDATSVSNDVVKLEWTAWQDPDWEGVCKLILYRKIEGDQDYTNLGLVEVSTPQTYYDTLPRKLCGDEVKYLIANGWPYYEIRSNFASVEMIDPIPTSPCGLRVASVDENSQKIVLSWFPSPDPDIKGYYLCHGNPCLDYDTVWGMENTSYVCEDLLSTEVHTFRVLAFDSCISPSPLTEHFHNIVLQLDYEDCDEWVNASWNAYQNMPDGLFAYRVMARYNTDGEWQEVDRKNPNDPLQCTIRVPVDATNIAVKIVALNADQTLEATSNIVSYDIATAESADFLYISSASVNDEGTQVSLKFYVDSSYEADHYTLYRATEDAGFSPIATIDYQATDRLSYIDNDVNGIKNSYQYKLSTLDGCNRNEKFSNTVKTILPRLRKDGPLANLQWTPYQGWEGTPMYSIMRRVGDSPWEFMDQSSQYTFVDNVSSIPNLDGAVFYKVIAHEPATSNYGFSDSAQSAQVAYRQSGSIYFPNAFTPGEETNNLFGPAYKFIDKYEIYIYNRAGDLIFTTTDPSEKWDGTYHGVQAPMGAYVYIANCTFVDLKKEQYVGTVLLIR